MSLHQLFSTLAWTGYWTKTKIQDFGDILGEPVQSVRACGEDIEVSESFTYLGSAVHNSGLSDHEVSRRIGLAAGVINSQQEYLEMPVSVQKDQAPCLQSPDSPSFAIR